MLIRNTTARYGLVAQTLHWLMFLMLVGMVTLGYVMDEVHGLLKIQIIGIHKATGICVLSLVALRLLWRAINITPNLPESTPSYQKWAAHGVHAGLYGMMVFLPVTGWMMSSAAGFPVSVYGFFTMPMVIAPDKALRQMFAEWHETGVVVFLVLAAAHVLAALVHHFYYKDNILRRMLYVSS